MAENPQMHVPDLARLRREELPEEIKAEVFVEAEVRAGLRCSGCRERVRSGLKVIQIDAAVIDGRPTVNLVGPVVCVDPECPALLTAIRDPHAVAVQKVSNRFLDDDPALAEILGGSPEPSPETEPEPDPVAA